MDETLKQKLQNKIFDESPMCHFDREHLCDFPLSEEELKDALKFREPGETVYLTPMPDSEMCRNCLLSTVSKKLQWLVNITETRYDDTG